MTRRVARALVALVAAGALLAPVAAREAPRGVLPVQPDAQASSTLWDGLDASEPATVARLDARGETDEASQGSRLAECNQGRARWTRAEIRCAIRRAWPADQRRALCVAWHESRLQPRAVGRAGERGLFQIHPIHRAWLGARRWARLFEPVENVRAARELQRRAGSGWSPWTTAEVC